MGPAGGADRTRRFDFYRLAVGACWVAAAAVIVWLAWRGADYYSTPLMERPRHGGYWRLKPGGSRGHLLGVIGSALMIVMLVYSLRKRWRPLRGAGQLRKWLDFHIFCGVFGPLLVILHSSFKVQGLVAISFWSMIAVALSGVLGRYLYLLIPRARSGDQLELVEVERLRADLAQRLETELGLPAAALESLAAAAAGVAGGARPARLPGGALTALRLRRRLRAVTRELGARFPALPPGALAEAARLSADKALLEQRIAAWARLQRLFHYWHVFHKPFAALMYLFMIVHVAVVLLTGYGWVPAG